MAGLFDSLTSASRSLSAHRMGLDVAGQNLANLNTVGYSRRMLEQAELPPTDRMSAGRGVEVLGVRGLRDVFVEARLRREQEGAAHEDAIVGGLATVEAAIGLPGEGLDARLTALFDAFASFADDVTSPAAREGAVQQGHLLAQTFNEMAERLRSARHDADTAIEGTVGEINVLASAVAVLNERIAEGGLNVETLIDERNVAVGRIAELADVNVLQNGTALDVSIAQGRALVTGSRSYALVTSPLPPDGLAGISSHGADITALLRGGRVGGLLEVRDTRVPQYQTALDQLAYDAADAINAVHTAGFDASGAPAGDFFVAPAGVAGAASLLAVDPALLANSQLLAGSSSGAVGDNGTAQVLAALRHAPIASGGTATLTDGWGQLAYVVGADVAAASSLGLSRAQVVSQLQQLRAQVSGVSVDEEAAQLMRYQRAYEASARFFTTINDTLGILMQMVG